MNPKQTVKAGYNRISSQYSASRSQDSEDFQLLKELVVRLLKDALLLDAGCGSGFPVGHFLAQHFRTVGVDFSLEQLRFARRRHSGVEPICGEITKLPVRVSMLEAIVCYYAIIHVPREEHSKLMMTFFRILKPGGLALLCMGASDLPEDLAEYHGVPMLWSHYGKETNLSILKEAGFRILWSRDVADLTDGSGVHLFILVQRPLEE